MSLGSLLGPSEAALEGLGTPKTLKNQWFFKVFAVVRFRYFGALDAPLGPILAPSWADLAPKWPPIWPSKWPKNNPKTGLKNDPQQNEN